MSINDGGPAFPVPFNWDADGNPRSSDEYGWGGMTRRQVLAMAAMHALLSNPEHCLGPRSVAADAYLAADAMLAHEARERGEKETTNG